MYVGDPLSAVAEARADSEWLFACRAGLSGAGLVDFADDVADLVASSAAAEGGKSTGLQELFGKHKLSQQYGADLAVQQQMQVRLGLHVLLEHPVAQLVHLRSGDKPPMDMRCCEVCCAVVIMPCLNCCQQFLTCL